MRIEYQAKICALHDIIAELQSEIYANILTQLQTQIEHAAAAMHEHNPVPHKKPLFGGVQKTKDAAEFGRFAIIGAQMHQP